MNKADMIVKLAPKLNVNQDEARVILNSVLEVIEEGLIESKSVVFVNWGTFKVQERAARQGRNPKTGEAVEIKAKQTISFKTGKLLDQKLNPEPVVKKTRKRK